MLAVQAMLNDQFGPSQICHRNIATPFKHCQNLRLKAAVFYKALQEGKV